VKSKIYVYAISDVTGFGDFCGMALAEDGTFLTSHISSNLYFVHHDMGVFKSDWKHDIYDKKYPDGWELEWIDYENLDSHVGFQIAYKLNQQMEENE